MSRTRFRRRTLLPALTFAALAFACDSKGDTTPPGGEGGADAPVDAQSVLAASNLPATVDAPLADDPMGVTIHRLSNGLTVYISTDRQKPRFAAWIAVRTGSRNDPADSTGLAHYLEHMLFKGTDEIGTLDQEAEQPHLDAIAQLYDDLRAAETEEDRQAIFKQIDEHTQATAKVAVPNEMTRLYSNIGVEGLNAFTSFDQTVYIADIPANRLEAWAQVEAERFADPRFRLFFPELEAVYEEKNISLDSPGRRVWETLIENLYPNHPYGTQTTIGEVEHLKVPAYGDMVEYFHRWYVPNNMAIILAGDIDPATALPVLEKTLGAWKPKALEAPEPGSLEGPKGRIVKEVQAEGERSVTIGFRTPASTHEDEPALVVMDWLMDNSKSGLINLELELSQKLPNAGSGLSSIKEAGWWSIRGTAREGQSLEEVEKLLLGVVAKLKAGEFDDKDVAAVVLEQVSSEKQQLESPWGRTSKMMSAFIEGREWSDQIARDKKLRAVTKAEVTAVANRYLGDDFVVVQRNKGKPDLPKIDKPKITPIDIAHDRKSPFAERIEKLPVEPLEPEWLEPGKHYVTDELPAGAMIANKNERNDLFQIVYEFDRGSRSDPMLCFAMDALGESGYGEVSAEQLRKELWYLGSSINFGCDVDDSSVRVSGIDENMDKTLELLDAWLADPKIEGETVKRKVENEISQRRDWIDNPRFVNFALREYASRDKESSFLRVPSNTALGKLTPKKVAKVGKAIFGYQHTTMYFGPRDAGAVKDKLGRGDKHKAVKSRKPVRYRKQKGAKIYFIEEDVAKSDVNVILPIGVREKGDRPASRVVSQYLGGGMSSAFFQEIREARGLAYSAWGGVWPGTYPDDEWAFSGAMGTQGDKTIEALTTYLELVRERPLGETQFGEAKIALEEEYRASRVDPRWVMYWVNGWRKRGEKSDPRPKEREDVASMDLAKAQAFADVMDDAPVIIAIVGNPENTDFEALGKIAKVVKLKKEQIFGYGKFPEKKKAKGEAKEGEKKKPAAEKAE